MQETFGEEYSFAYVIFFKLLKNYLCKLYT